MNRTTTQNIEEEINREDIDCLTSLMPGERGIIQGIQCDGLTRRRFLDLGLVNGAEIEVIRKSILGDPIAYRVKGTQLAIRKIDGAKIMIKLIHKNGRTSR